MEITIQKLLKKLRQNRYHTSGHISAVEIRENKKYLLKNKGTSQRKLNAQERKWVPSVEQEYENRAIRNFFHKSVEGGVIGCHLEDGFPLYFINDMMLDYLEYESEAEFAEAIQRKTINVIHPADRQMVSSSIFKQLSVKDDYTVTYRIQKKSGEYVWVREVGTRTDNDRNLLISVYTDVTRQHDIEEQLKLSNLQLNNIINSIPGGVAIYKVSDIFETVYFSNGVPDLSGYTVEEYKDLIKQDASNLTYYEDTEMVVSSVREALVENRTVDINFRKQHRDGSIVWVHMQGNKIGEEDGCPLIQCVFHNITSLMETERQLRESERKQALAIEGADMSIWEYDILERCIYQTPVSMAKHGFSQRIENVPESLIEQGYVHENDIEAFLDMYRKICTGQPKAEGTFWVKELRSDRWWCEHITYSVEFDQSGRPVKAYGASHDVTLENLEKKKYEEELLYIDRMSGSILSCCRINLSQKRVEEFRIGKDLEADQNYADALDFVSRTKSYLLENYATDEQNRTLSPEYLLKAYKDGHNRITEKFLGKMKSGEYVWIKTDVNLISRFNSTDVIAFYYDTDISSETTMKLILDTIMRFEYDEISCIYLKNDKYSIISGKSVSAALKPKGIYSQELKTFCSSVDESEREAVYRQMVSDNLSRRLEEKQPFTIECHMKGQTGESRLKQLRFMYLDQRTGMVLMTKADIDDVMEKERMKQELLEQALKAAEMANSAKSDFLSRVSHDLRTPMNTILGLANLGLEAKTKEYAVDCLKKINASGQYLLNLINDTLDVSRIEQNGLTLKPQAIHTQSLIESVVDPIRILASEKEIDFIVDMGNIADTYILADEMRVCQIFSNLLSNAMKFTPPRGKVELICRCLSREGNLSKCEIIVKDNGIGMNAEFLENLYKPFEQESNEVTPLYQGSGLGMTIVKSLVQMMGGRIEVKSEKGEGTEFAVYLDFERTEEVSEQKEDDQAETNIKGMKILLFEDHPLNAEIAIKILEKAGCSVDHAADGVEGLELFQKSPEYYYEAVLMDIRMPKMDGIQATTAIRSLQRRDALTVPVIAMTANAYNEDKEKSFAAGMNDHLTKPIVPAILYSALTKVRAADKSEDRWVFDK